MQVKKTNILENKKVIIFDFDGTIIQWYELNF